MAWAHYPEAGKIVHSMGHEIASHGWRWIETDSLESQEFLGICPMRKATWIGLSQDRSGRVGRPIFSGKRRVTSITEGTNSSALVHRQHAEETDTPRKVMPGEVTAIAPGVEGRL